MRNRVRRNAFLRKRMNTNPARGPFHHSAPSEIFKRAVRGMVPHKTSRGAEAMGRLQCFDGVPAPYDKKKRMVVPDAYRVSHLRPDRAYISLGHLADQFGWKYGHLIQRLEKQRLAESKEYHEKKTSA